uniref:Macrophage mannose receptor 1-like n=1 Tax=Salarias fasciatus TaxID=181472 RepID=A0A672HCM6_SALFA
MSAVVRLIRRTLAQTRPVLALFIFILPLLQCTATNDSPFSLTNKATGFCLVKKANRCLDVRWTTGGRLFVTSTKKCLGAQGKSVGSEVSLYDCDDKNDLQKWECRNGTLIALKNQQLYIEVRVDESIALSRTVGPNNYLTITGTSSGACTRTHRELYTIEGNAFGKICMFPFMYKDRWFGDCTTFDSSSKRYWCAVETKYEHEQWGYCPTSYHWAKNLVTGAYYQINGQAALTWAQAQTSCNQQAASLVSITDPNQQAFISALLGSGKKKLWLGLVLNPEHGWHWSDEKPYRYLRWDAGNPLHNPGHNCAILDSSGQHSWQSSTCSKKLGYICYKEGSPPAPPHFETGFCASPWIPYNGHCFHLHRPVQSWPDARRECRKEGGDLVSIRNVEDQSFVITQLGYASTDELWIGLNDRTIEGLFDWSDHSAVSFTSWKYGEPAISSDTENCVLITGQNGNWADRACEEKHGFICMKQSSTESTEEEIEQDIGCKVNWKRHGSYCYFIGTETKTFDDAKEDCKSSGSYLADVSSGVDNAFLVSLVGWRPEKHFWIGLSNRNNIEVFTWTNTDVVKFTHWNADMPGFEQGCVAMTSGILAGLWDLLPCTNKTKYICKHLAEGAVSTIPPPTKTPLGCAEGWTRMATRNTCYKFFTGPRSHEKTWFEARDYCRAIGGDLLSIHSAIEQAVGRYGAWIGLHVPDSGSGYVWSDGTPLNFQHWMEGEPNNFNNAESCVEFTIYNWDDSGSWNDAHCEGYNDWLCQIRAGTDVNMSRLPLFNTTPDGWLEWRGNQYFINRYSKSMEEARHFCQQRHGDLATINSKEENTFLWKQISRTYGSFYFGLSVDLDGSLWWMDGSPISFERWAENQPNTNVYDERCVFMSYHMGEQEEYELTSVKDSAVALTLTQYVTRCYFPRFLEYKFSTRQLYCRPHRCQFELVKTYFLCQKLRNWAMIVVVLTNQLWCSCTERKTFCTTVLSTDPTIPAQPEVVESNIYVHLGNDSVKVITQNLTWDEAKKRCEVDKANLASLRNEWTRAHIELLAMNLKTPLWIGLNKKQTGDYFRYVDGWHINFANWAAGEPSRERPCVYLDVEGKMNTAFCNQTMNSVCMQSTDVPPTESTVFPGNCPPDTDVDYFQSYTWLPFRGHCYLFVHDEIEWADAASSCVRHGGILASIEDPAEQQFIKSNVEIFQDSHSSFWIGLFKTYQGTWLWLDKTVMDYTNWALYEPDSDYGAIRTSDGAWSSGRRWHDRAYICKKAKVFSLHFQDPRSRLRTSLVVVLIIAIVSTLMVVAFVLYKKSPKPLPTFENPLYVNSEQSPPDVVDTNKMIEIAENPEPILSL